MTVSVVKKTVPMRDILAAEVGLQFVNAWMVNSGPPVELIEDNGSCFTSKFFIDVCNMKIKNNFTTTSHRQSNDPVKRYNRTMLKAL